jgi:hypothetical protein
MYTRRRGQGLLVAFKSHNVDATQVVSRLIEQCNADLEEHGTNERKLHLPATREQAYSVGLVLIGAADSRCKEHANWTVTIT